MYRIEVDGNYWRIRSTANGEILCHSQQYATAWNARRAARQLSKVTGLTWVRVN